MNEPIRLQDVRCPACGRLLFRARPCEGGHAEVKCTCRRLIVVRRGVQAIESNQAA